MATLSSEFKKNIESAIKEYGRFACPNIVCTDWITSKEIIKNDGSQFLEYHCQNPKCTFHPKKTVLLKEKKQAQRIESHPISANYKAVMMVLVSILLVMIVAFSINKSSSISKIEKTPTVEEKRTIVL